jgi:hypothetical protein
MPVIGMIPMIRPKAFQDIAVAVRHDIFVAIVATHYVDDIVPRYLSIAPW